MAPIHAPPTPAPAMSPDALAAPDQSRPTAATLITLMVLAGVLYVGRDIFLPLAVAILLTFSLAPIVNLLRKWSVPRIPAVLITVTITFAVIGLFSFIVATQVTSLAQNIPAYQANIVQKVHSLKELGAGGGLVDRINNAVARVGAEIGRPAAPAGGGQALGGSAETAQAPQKPVPVEVVSKEGPVEILRNVIVPLVSPFATAGLIIVVVIFMLLEREDLRDRFIRLVGAGDLHRTTQALQEAGARVGHYLLMQLVVNTLYAIPIALGLWLLGIPNAVLWGLLTLVLRFVPYIGPVIGMMFPLFLAVAVSPDWSLLLWTAGLFITVELISNNFIEPWLYGARTGLSAMAIIVSAIVWTSLWGPLGLVLSTPITVCMMVLGRHVPQFAFLHILLGNKPVLEPHQRLYQRLLAGDPHEAADNAEDYLENDYLVDYYENIGLPALRMGEIDRQRGVLDDAQRTRFAATAHALVESLEDIAEEEEAEDEAEVAGDAADVRLIRAPRAALAKIGSRLGLNGDSPDEDGAQGSASGDSASNEVGPASGDASAAAPALVLPDGEGRNVVIIGGRGELDDIAAAMLGQALAVQGAETAVMSYADISGSGRLDLPLENADTIVLAYLNVSSAAHARQTIRRLRRQRPQARTGVFVPLDAAEPPLPFNAQAVYADFLATGMREAVAKTLDPDEGASPEAGVSARPGEPLSQLQPAGRRMLRPLRGPRAPVASEA